MIHIAKWKITIILAILLAGLIFALPNFVSTDADGKLPSWVPGPRVNLGLDLQGGAHLLYEVAVDDVIKEQLNSVVDAVRTELRKRKIGYTDLGVEGTAVRFTLTDPADTDTVRTVLRDEIAQGMELDIGSAGDISVGFSSQALAERKLRAVEQSIEVVRRRIDELGTREPTIQRSGTDRILVQLPGVKDPAEVKRIIGTTAKMTFRFVDDNASLDPSKLPPTDELLPGDEADAAGGGQRMYPVQKRVMVSGENLTSAQPTLQNGQWVVSFGFDSIGAKRFGDATKTGVGKRFAIVLDNKVISAPVIRSEILGGQGVIEGGFTSQSASDLALLLRAGALPAPMKVLEERTVGAGLGADSIAAGKLASILALVLIVVSMVVLYGLFGLFAVCALIFNGVLLLAALSLLQATLTLPGIAGIVLTLGMAVDANVLIFERIREEIREGRGPVTAMEAGYRGAMATIIDTHVTTLISGIILIQFGTGPVKGFAVALSIGIIISIFTAVWVTRLFTVLWFERVRPKVLPI
jgi:preprotein translocase subunit SecD